MTYKDNIKSFYGCDVTIKNAKVLQKDYRKKAHKSFVKENRGWFWFFDVAIVLLLLFNYGAAALTNALLMSNPEIKLYEGNSIQVDINNYEEHDESKARFVGFYFQAFMWSIILFGYLFFRTHIFEFQDFYIMAFFTVLYLFSLSFDFVNNFGFYIGKIIFGG